LESRQVKDTGDDELISLFEVSRIFDRSIDAMRKYRGLRLIEPSKRVGRKDFYKKKDIIYAKYLIEKKLQEGKKLHEIAEDLRRSEDELDAATEHINKKSKKILIIEDLELVQKIIQRCLRQCFPEGQLDVYHAEDGLGGIKYARKALPDLIVLDLALPVLTGDKVYEELSSDPSLAHSKFIIISANIEYKPQGTEFLGKPLKMALFIKAVEKLTGLKALPNRSGCTDTSQILTPNFC